MRTHVTAHRPEKEARAIKNHRGAANCGAYKRKSPPEGRAGEKGNEKGVKKETNKERKRKRKQPEQTTKRNNGKQKGGAKKN